MDYGDNDSLYKNYPHLDILTYMSKNRIKHSPPKIESFTYKMKKRLH